MKATNNGSLRKLEDCYIKIPVTFDAGDIYYPPSVSSDSEDPNKPYLTSQYRCDVDYDGFGTYTVYMRSLPDISDSKQAVYNNEAIIGRSFPMYTYSHSADRQIHLQLHFYVTERCDIQRNLNDLRAIQSAVYPRPGSDVNTPFKPPPICQIKCGQLLSSGPLCAILQSYSVKFPTEVIWDESTFCPFKFDIDTSWLAVYTSNNLPNQGRILIYGG
jgi:hypothetical protein